MWVKHLATDAQARIDSSIAADPRVARFWDPSEVSGRWFTEQRLSRFGFAWDIAYVYTKDAALESPQAWLSPVIHHAQELEATLLQLLRASS